MANLIRVKCDETEIWIESECETIEAEAPERVAVMGKVPVKIIPFEEISSTIQKFCTSLAKTFKGLEPEYTPSRLSAEFGLKLSAGGTVYIVKSTAECSLKIKVEWQIK